MKKLLRHKGIWILAVALSLSLIVAALSILLGERAGPLSSLSHMITSPLQTAVSAVEQNVSHFYGQAAQYEQLRLEKEALQKQVAELEGLARDGQLAREENTRLRSLLDFKQRRQDLTFEPARVSSESATNWNRNITLSKGSKSGISARDCVVDASGRLIGIVSEVGSHFSTVVLISDAGFSLGGSGVPTEEHGVLCGDASLMKNGQLRFSFLPRDTKLVKGNEVLSFASEGLYPSGLLVGHIASIDFDEGGLYAHATITPAADLSHLNQVFVVTDFNTEE